MFDYPKESSILIPYDSSIACRIIKKSGLKINALPVDDVNEILGVNTIPQLKEAEEIMKARLGDEK